jgi:hypothetical protein
MCVAAACAWLLHVRGCCMCVAAACAWLLHVSGCCMCVPAEFGVSAACARLLLM